MPMNGSETPRAVKSRRMLLAFAVLVVLLTIAGAVSFVRYAQRNAPNPQLVAVAPFDIFVPGLEAWRVGLAEALTEQPRTTPPRPPPPPRAARRGGGGHGWRPPPPPKSPAVERPRRTSAGIAVYGRV